MVIRQELEFLALQEERKDGYRRVATPHYRPRKRCYYRSRHLPYYGEACIRRSISTARITTLRADELPASSI